MPRRLTDISVRNLKARTKRYELADPGARGLYVVVFPSGKRSYVLRYRHAGRPKKLTLTPGINLATARKAAADAMHAVAQGHDPGEAKKQTKTKAAAAAINTVQNICEEYLQREGGKLRTAADREATLRLHVYPALGSRQVAGVKRSEIVRLLDRIEDNSGARMADLTLAYLRRIFNWHATRDDDFITPIIRGMSRYNTADHARSRILNDAELKAVWEAADEIGYPGHYVQFLLLTAARRTEAANLQWDEIDGDVWVLPARRNKTGLDFARPLSKATLRIIAAQPQQGPFVFSFTGQIPVGQLGSAERRHVACRGHGEDCRGRPRHLRRHPAGIEAFPHRREEIAGTAFPTFCT